jgi:hypothetical protein
MYVHVVEEAVLHREHITHLVSLTHTHRFSRLKQATAPQGAQPEYLPAIRDTLPFKLPRPSNWPCQITVTIYYVLRTLLKVGHQQAHGHLALHLLSTRIHCYPYSVGAETGVVKEARRMDESRWNPSGEKGRVRLRRYVYSANYRRINGSKHR